LCSLHLSHTTLIYTLSLHDALPIYCRHKFIKKPKLPKQKLLKINWLDLQEGDLIVVKGGPYWINSNGDKLYVGERGKYRVRRLEKDAIFASPKDESATVFLYMGKDYKSESTGTIMQKYQIRLLKKRE